MKRFIIAAIFSVFALQVQADVQSEVMAPSAKVYAGKGSGSATAIKVDPILGTYLVTNYHVVDAALDDLAVEFHGSDVKHVAYVHSYDQQNDIAIIIVRHKHDAVALIGNPPDMFADVYCVGASFGLPVAPSRGIITGVDFAIFGSRYVTRTDCKIAPGNSGGGMFAFQDGKWRYVGMPSMVYALGAGFTRIPMTFLGFSVRIEEIRWHVYRHGVLNLPPVYRNGVQ